MDYKPSRGRQMVAIDVVLFYKMQQLGWMKKKKIGLLFNEVVFEFLNREENIKLLEDWEEFRLNHFEVEKTKNPPRNEPTFQEKL